MEKAPLDILWVVLSAGLVFMMQAGFLCLESGLTRAKNAINVGLKNMTDFALSVMLYWMFGFALMFGASQAGWIGASFFLAPVGHGDAWLSAFFLFQAMFCATAATIMSGATAERLHFGAYLLSAGLIAGIIYPVYGHWAWGGAFTGMPGWLEARGFIDFAGSTVVHSVGGWVALAALLIIGPRQGRYGRGETIRKMPGSNLPLAMLGVLLLTFGWFGFNGGSTMAFDARVGGIIVNSILAAVAGTLTVLAITWRLLRHVDAVLPLNGLLAGLVAITASAHAVSATSAVMIGAMGGVAMLAADQLMHRWRIDDAVGAVPVHLGAGIWGTLAVALFASPEVLGTGLGMGQQLVVQGLGVAVCALWAFGIAYLVLGAVNRRYPLRVGPDDERLGLNISEHGARTELIDLLETMEIHERSGASGAKVTVEPFTEVGQIAAQYNRVLTALDQARSRTQAIVRDIRDGIVTFSCDGLLTSFNPGAETMFGLSAADALGQPLAGFVDEPNWRPETLLPPAGTDARLELNCRRSDGMPFIAEIMISHGKSDGEFYTGTLRDITERRRIEEQLFQEKMLAQVTLAAINDGVITTDRGGRVQYLNPVAENLTGWETAQAVGLPLLNVYNVVTENTGLQLPNPVRLVLRNGVPGQRDQQCILRRRDGREFPVQDAAAPIRDSEERIIGAVLTFRDVSATHQLARELSHQAAHDALTGLANRAEFERRLERLLGDGLDEAGHVLCYMDLDQFKVVNDTCGHVAGDELLRQLSALFKGRVRSHDLLARLGGDEFGILFFGCPITQAATIAEAIRQDVEDFRFVWENRTFAVGASLGLVAINGDCEAMGPLLSAADAACYAAKDAGRNRVHIYQLDDSNLLQRQGEMQWASRIRQALDEDQLRLCVQPIVAIQAGADDGNQRFEVLVRMQDGSGRMIPPGAFMPAAERYNLSPAVDRWVIANTLAWIGDFCRRPGSRPGHYSINLSAASLSEETFLRFVLDCISRHGVVPGCICFEITETSAIANLSKAVAFMEALKAIGCSFALDDFGSGLSSFAYLKNLPVDYIKIDGVFVKDICNDPIARAMVSSINNIGHEMGLKTVAEFVESQEILEVLRDIGCDYAQGFHLGRPQPLAQLQEVRMMPR